MTSSFSNQHTRTALLARLFLAVLLFAGTLALYASAIRNSFVNYDDPDYVTRNAHVSKGLLWSNVVWAFSLSNYAANWHPLTWISHMADVQWYGNNPAGHHFTNILLHSLDVALLFLLLDWATGLTLRSGAVAVLFAVHPLNVESVAWIAERKTPLSVLFFLLALWGYGWYVRKPGVGRYALVAIFFSMALMAKVMVIAFPLALLLLDFWPFKRFPHPETSVGGPGSLRVFLNLILEKVPLFLLAAADAWLMILAQRKTGSVGNSLALPLAWRVKNALYSYVAYLRDAIWPVRLAVFYPHPEGSLSWTKVLAATAVLIAISALVWRYREKRYLLTGWLWFLGTMFPMIGIVQSGRQGMADRYAYIPLLGIFLAVIWLLGDWAGKVQLRQRLLIILFLVACIPYVYLTRKQIGYWKDSYTLFRHTLEVTANNGIAENNFGSALMERGEPAQAEAHFEAATRLIPGLASAHYNLGVILQTGGRADEAAREYRLAIANSSDPLELAQSHNNLGILDLQSGKSAEALTELSAAIALNPEELNSYIGRGMVELQFWNVDASIADFSRALAISPSPVAYFNLGRALEAKGDFSGAANAYSAALRLAPGMIEAQSNLQTLRTRMAK